MQLLLGHTKIEITVRYLGVEVDDALGLAEQVGFKLLARNQRSVLPEASDSRRWGVVV